MNIIFAYGDPYFTYTTDYDFQTRCRVDVMVPMGFEELPARALVVVTQDPDEKPCIADNISHSACEIGRRILNTNGFGGIPFGTILWVERYEATREIRFERMEQVTFRRLSDAEMLDEDLRSTIGDPIWHTITAEQIEHHFKMTFQEMGLPERTRYVS
jgi:hypothetical protein